MPRTAARRRAWAFADRSSVIRKRAVSPQPPTISVPATVGAVVSATPLEASEITFASRQSTASHSCQTARPLPWRPRQHWQPGPIQLAARVCDEPDIYIEVSSWVGSCLGDSVVCAALNLERRGGAMNTVFFLSNYYDGPLK